METLQKRYPVLRSSFNQDNLSLTVKGLLIGLIPLAIYFGKQSGIELTEAGLVELINLIAIFISGAGIMIGAFRKIVIWIDKKRNRY